MNLQRSKPHRQTPRSKAKIPLVLSLQASLPPHPAGEDEVEERSERRKQRLAKRVNVTARRREELLEAGCWVKKITSAAERSRFKKWIGERAHTEKS